LAVAEKDPKSGEWRLLNGNQIGVLFADWVWQQHKARHPTADHSKAVMLASAVSSKMLKAMARREGFKFVGTLTGFKWLGNVGREMEEKGYTFLFAYEVEIGFLVGNLSMDKDGVRTGVIFYEMANQLYKRGITLVQHLETLSQRYGYFQQCASYYFCYSGATMDRIFARLRTMNNGSYVDHCGPFAISSVRDVTLGIDTGKPGNRPDLPKVTDSQMITFRFANGSLVTMRNSGTEPKLKFYVESSSTVSENAARTLVEQLTKCLVSEFLQPEQNGLVAKKIA